MDRRLPLGLVSLVVVAMLVPIGIRAQSFVVTAEIVPGCTLVGSTGGGSLDFGTLSFGTVPAVFNGDLSGAAAGAGGTALRVECTPGVQFEVGVDEGLHSMAGHRHLLRSGGSDLVPYGLFADAAHSIALPIAGGVTLTSPSNGMLDLPIYGRATLPGVGLRPGVYTDTVQVTVSW